MYRLPEFVETDVEKMIAFMKAHPFITLIGNYENKNAVTQVPVLIANEDGKIKLSGHFMKQTDHHFVFEKNEEALVLFTGGNCYVSASWYQERGIGSTWNYRSVQAKGKLKFLEEQDTIKLLMALTHHFEDGQEKPELVENMHPDYVPHMVKAIVGFEIEVAEMKATFKLSQNRDDESFKRIVYKLSQQNDFGSQEISEIMKQERPGLFEGL